MEKQKHKLSKAQTTSLKLTSKIGHKPSQEISKVLTKSVETLWTKVKSVSVDNKKMNDSFQPEMEDDENEPAEMVESAARHPIGETTSGKRSVDGEGGAEDDNLSVIRMEKKAQRTPVVGALNRRNSDYISQPVENQTPSGSSSLTSHFDPQVARKHFYDRLQFSIKLCDQDLFENALMELKAIEQSGILAQLPGAFKCVLNYNQACCLHRLGLVPSSIDMMKEALIALEDEVSKHDSQDGITESYRQTDMASSFIKSFEICEKLHRQRVLCKLSLQICAILSQANSHDLALDMASKADQHARKIVDYTSQLCQLYLQSVVFREQQTKAVACSESNPYTNPPDSEQDDEFSSQRLVDNDYSPIYSGSRRAAHQLLHSWQASQQKKASDSKRHIESSFVSSNNATITNLKVRQRSQSKSGKTRRNNEDQSLERVHTFHLKRSPSKESLPHQSRVAANDELPRKNGIQNFQFAGEDKLLRQAVENLSSIKTEVQTRNKLSDLGTQNKSHLTSSMLKQVLIDRAFYIQENTRASDDVVVRNIQPVIAELARLLKLETLSDTKETLAYKNLRGEFHTEQDFEEIRHSQKFKLFCIRSVLGLPKTSISAVGKQPPLQIHTLQKKDEQWIYHLNIGNVMYMMPMDSDEAAKLEGSKFGMRRTPMSNIQGVTGGTASMNCSPDRYKRLQNNSEICQGRETPSLEEIQIRVKHELSKDEMLEKVVLVVVSLFCMGTELRFKSQLCSTPTGRDSSLSMHEFESTKASSERWHANAIHLACIFLPDECPLVSHMINSYKKHHLRNKVSVPAQVVPKSADQGRRIIEVNLQRAIQVNIFSSDTGASSSKNAEEQDGRTRQKQKLVAELLKDCLNKSKQAPQSVAKQSNFSQIKEKNPQKDAFFKPQLNKTALAKPNQVFPANISPILSSLRPYTCAGSSMIQNSPKQIESERSRNQMTLILTQAQTHKPTTSSHFTIQHQVLRTNATKPKQSQQHLYPNGLINSSQARSPRQNNANLKSPRQVHNKNQSKVSKHLINSSGKKLKDTSHFSDAADDIAAVNEMKSDRLAVKREFGMVKKPMDNLHRGNILTDGGRTPVAYRPLKTSPRPIQLYLAPDDEDERAALTERSSSHKKNRSNLKLDELLQQFERLQYKTLSGKQT